MGDNSRIEWTDATWNPVTGCSKVSPGCAHCYAATLAPRLHRMGQAGYTDLPWTPENAGENVILHPERLDLPIRWTRPRRIFVNSMSDLFHERVPSWFIGQVFATMSRATRHTFQVLTKRPELMAGWFSAVRHSPGGWLTHNGDDPRGWRTRIPGLDGDGTGEIIQDGNGWPLPNVWLGTSIENDRWTVRAEYLRATPAAVRFLSCEPLLGPLPSLDLTGIDWVIVGGESGPGYRPIDPDWVRDIRDRCAAAGVPFFLKQWGGRRAGGEARLDGVEHHAFPVAR